MVLLIAYTPMRFATKFGVSLPNTMPLPRAFVPKSTHVSTASWSVSGPWTSSSSFMKRTGLKKCVTRKFCLNIGPKPSVIDAIDRPEVFDDRIAPHFISGSIRANSLRLMSRFSTTASMMMSHSDSSSRSSSKLPGVIIDANFSW